MNRSLRRSIVVVLTILLFWLLRPSATTAGDTVAKATKLSSPKGHLAVYFDVDSQGTPGYRIELDGHDVLLRSPLGLIREDADFSQGLQLVTTTEATTVDDHYEILTAKRRHNHYRAHRQVFRLATANGQPLEIEFQVSNDGVAFRYVFPDSSGQLHRVREETSSFCFPQTARAWLQPMSVAKTGWQGSNPCYEEYYELDVPVGTASPSAAGWCFPALFHANQSWVVVSECNLTRGYCASRLRSKAPQGHYRIGLPDPREGIGAGAVAPTSTLPWTTPWRLIAVGDLATVAESTLGTDLAAPARTTTTAQPGKSAWSWALMKDAATVYDVQRRMIDYAADMHWEYCLIDADWDRQIGPEKLAQLTAHAEERGVKIIVWENAAGDWNTTPYTPRSLLLTRADREREFQRLAALGVDGMKIDFFGGDGQSMIEFYLDLLEESAPYNFAINFHGSTPPRGWQRTFPHLMTTESVRGLEHATFEQRHADAMPRHIAMLPFTRNIFDPMDFTPLVLDQIPRIERRTTSAFELATAVVLTSGIQHYAEIPAGMAKAPDYVREFLQHVPSVWDDTKFLDGYPGEYVVVARRGQERWYVAGINASDQERSIDLNLQRLKTADTGTLIADGSGGNLSFRREQIDFQGQPLSVTVPPRGGFVLTCTSEAQD